MSESHIPNCGFWNTECPRCRTMTVGQLDNDHFREVMGCTRTEFEAWCLAARDWAQAGYDVVLEPEPFGLYNFWYPIMESGALKMYLGAKSMAGLFTHDRTGVKTEAVK